MIMLLLTMNSKVTATLILFFF